MQTDAHRTRTSYLRAIKRAYPHRNTRRTVLLGASDPLFPLTYFLRNLRMLGGEKAWDRLPLRARRRLILKMLRERAAFFREVKKWVMSRQDGRASVEFCRSNLDPAHPISYCTHCGGCCEIASGYPDFPEDSAIPLRWKMIFGNGLGRGHRFCPFLWELSDSGGSLCPIHLWRSRPCRVFEGEECEFFLNDPDYIRSTDPTVLAQAHRYLLRLI